VLLNRVERKAMGMSQGSERATKRMKSKMRIQPQRSHQGAKSAAEMPLSKNIQRRSRAIRKKGVLRTNRKEGLKRAKSSERAQMRARDRKESESGRLVKSFSPPKGHNQLVGKKANVPPTKMPERIKRGGSRRNEVRNTKHGQEGQRESSTV
jgi:hypothetical protein